MDRRPHFRMPLFFKLWFGFVATLALAILGVTIWGAAAMIEAGPEGVGQMVGAAVRGFNEASR